MPQSINTNIMSLNAQRNLNRTQADLATSIQRLSSGLRINSAKDDAAGIAIATRMSVQVNGLSVAIRNANDGISITQTAEGAMDEMVKSLIRANDLALQAASYNTDADRASLNQEVSQIIEELGRIVSQTRFNGQQLLQGGFTADIQVGTQVAETIGIQIGNLSTGGLGVSSNFTAIDNLDDAGFAARALTQFTGAFNATETLNGVDLGAATTASTTLSSTKIDQINSTTATSGVQAFNYGNSLLGTAAAGAGTTAQGDVVINGIAIGAASGAAGLATAINAESNQHGVTATISGGFLVLHNDSGAAITMTVGSAGAATASGLAQGTHSVDAGTNGLIVLSTELGGSAVFSSAGGGAAVGEGAAAATLTNATLTAADINTVASANLALLTFQSALDSINSDRAILGAQQNRFESTIRNLENVRENITAARGRIQDADFAQETAALTRSQILQQAGIAMVSQANAIPQAALALLQ